MRDLYVIPIGLRFIHVRITVSHLCWVGHFEVLVGSGKFWLPWGWCGLSDWQRHAEGMAVHGEGGSNILSKCLICNGKLLVNICLPVFSGLGDILFLGKIDSERKARKMFASQFRTQCAFFLNYKRTRTCRDLDLSFIRHWETTEEVHCSLAGKTRDTWFNKHSRRRHWWMGSRLWKFMVWPLQFTRL